jgi:hypothetical protein
MIKTKKQMPKLRSRGLIDACYAIHAAGAHALSSAIMLVHFYALFPLPRSTCEPHPFCTQPALLNPPTFRTLAVVAPSTYYSRRSSPLLSVTTRVYTLTSPRRKKLRHPEYLDLQVLLGLDCTCDSRIRSLLPIFNGEMRRRIAKS